ncbi:complement component 1 Q subcomponent-Hypothetical protein protein [Nesidiocoris tenuis]|uniref:Complement component 1 Q subcomponent-binding protein, mitochondrial n=1 Tax=Nesidiocoris tenuis TaxID=355587 RepID=A0ABN7AUX8_9HEMI|nr:complement component 1 Q subcomponent-Hypothetical protein protein [Nesidiocoris tenuis]
MSAIIKNSMKLQLLTSAGSIVRNSATGIRHHAGAARCLAVGRLHQPSPSVFNNCVSCSGFHTQGSCLMNKAAAQTTPSAGEKELADFLTEEIAAEKKLQTVKNIPTELDGFKVNLDHAEVSLVKKSGDETIEVNFNINHSVDADVEPEINPTADKPELGAMKSRPVFEVEIKKGAQTLGFTCTIVSPSSESSENEYNDLFTIDEVVLYDGEWVEKNYAVSGEVLDGTLYDLLMNMLEDKGITNDFVEKLVEFSTSYEHSKYIGLLEKLQKFASSK